MHPKSLQQAFFLSVLIGVLLLTGFIFWPYAVVIAVSATVAVILHPFYLRVLHLVKGREGIASSLTVLSVIVLALAPLSFVLYQVVNEAHSAYVMIQSNQDKNILALEQAFFAPLQQWFPSFQPDMEMYTQQIFDFFTGHIGALFTSTVQTILDVFLGVISLYYFLKDGKRFLTSLIALSPLADKYDQQIFKRMSEAINSVLRGQLLIALIQGFLSGVGFAIFGVPNPALWGTIAALCALVPGVGTSLVLIPVIAYLFLSGAYLPAIGMTVWGAFGVGLIDNLIGPTLIGKGARIHPLFVLFGVIGGIALFGPMGFLLGPLTVSLLYALLDIYQLVILKPKGRLG